MQSSNMIREWSSQPQKTVVGEPPASDVTPSTRVTQLSKQNVRSVTPFYKSSANAPNGDAATKASAAVKPEPLQTNGNPDYRVERRQEHFRLQVIEPTVESTAHIPAPRGLPKPAPKLATSRDFPSGHTKRSFVKVDPLETRKLRSVEVRPITTTDYLAESVERHRDMDVSPLKEYLKLKEREVNKNWNRPGHPGPKRQSEIDALLKSMQKWIVTGGNVAKTAAPAKESLNRERESSRLTSPLRTVYEPIEYASLENTSSRRPRSRIGFPTVAEPVIVARNAAAGGQKPTFTASAARITRPKVEINSPSFVSEQRVRSFSPHQQLLNQHSLHTSNAHADDQNSSSTSVLWPPTSDVGRRPLALARRQMGDAARQMRLEEQRRRELDAISRREQQLRLRQAQVETAAAAAPAATWPRAYPVEPIDERELVKNRVVRSDDVLAEDDSCFVDILDRREAFIERPVTPPPIERVGRVWQPPPTPPLVLPPRRPAQRHFAAESLAPFEWTPYVPQTDFKTERKNFTPEPSPPQSPRQLPLATADRAPRRSGRGKQRQSEGENALGRVYEDDGSRWPRSMIPGSLDRAAARQLRGVRPPEQRSMPTPLTNDARPAASTGGSRKHHASTSAVGRVKQTTPPFGAETRSGGVKRRVDELQPSSRVTAPPKRTDDLDSLRQLRDALQERAKERSADYKLTMQDIQKEETATSGAQLSNVKERVREMLESRISNATTSSTSILPKDNASADGLTDVSTTTWQFADHSFSPRSVVNVNGHSRDADAGLLRVSTDLDQAFRSTTARSNAGVQTYATLPHQHTQPQMPWPYMQAVLVPLSGVSPGTTLTREFNENRHMERHTSMPALYDDPSRHGTLIKIKDERGQKPRSIIKRRELESKEAMLYPSGAATVGSRSAGRRWTGAEDVVRSGPVGVRETVSKTEESTRTEEVERRVREQQKKEKKERKKRRHREGSHQEGYRSSGAIDGSGYGYKHSRYGGAVTNGYGGGNLNESYRRESTTRRIRDGSLDGAFRPRQGSLSESLRRGDLRYVPNGEVRQRRHSSIGGSRVQSNRDIYRNGYDDHYQTYDSRRGPIVEFPPTLPRHEPPPPAPPPHRNRSGGGHLYKSRSLADWDEARLTRDADVMLRDHDMSHRYSAAAAAAAARDARFGSFDDDMSRLQRDFHDSLLMPLPAGQNVQEKEFRQEQIPGGHESLRKEVKATSGQRKDDPRSVTHFNESKQEAHYNRETSRGR